MTPKRFGWSCVYAFGLTVLSSSAFAQNAPKKYAALYRELDAQLSAFEIRLPPRSRNEAPVKAATLFSARCELGDAQLSDEQRTLMQRELDALKLLGANGVVLQVCYPLLTPGFRDSQRFLELYTNLANEIHRRGMKLLVEHNTLIADLSSVDPRPYYKRLTPQRFTTERYEELKIIVRALEPEFVTLISEPSRYDAGTKLGVKGWRRAIERTIAGLARDLGSFSTTLGAGAALTEDPQYVEAFAAIKSLGYIDLHLSRLASGDKSMLHALAQWPDRIRAVDPQKRLVMSELWLAKSSAQDAPRGNAAITARSVYSFWSPLDQKLLRIVSVLAREQNFDLIAAAQSGYFFAYLDFNDPVGFRLGASALLDLVTLRAADELARGNASDTGLAFRGL